MALLSGCAATNCNRRLPILNLPEMPVAGSKVADELSVVCDDKKCPNIMKWLNEIYLFRQQYLIYKSELAIR